MTHTIVGVDIAKSVMQIHCVDPETGEVVNRPLKRAAFLEYFANRSPCLVGMESCGGSQHWARRLCQLGGRRLPVLLKRRYPYQIASSTATVTVQPCHVAKRSLSTAR
jgi:hypothetical protein